MTTQEIATRLYDLCEKHDSETAHKELYSSDATSTERNMQGSLETVKGMDAIGEKNKKFQSMLEEMHGGYTNKPTVYGPFIFMEMGMDATMKGMGRMNMVEMCQYETKDGKIIAERFFY
jgi:hypothetical protein